MVQLMNSQLQLSPCSDIGFTKIKFPRYFFNVSSSGENLEREHIPRLSCSLRHILFGILIINYWLKQIMSLSR